ncbi:MAG: hypothetical protein IIW52_08560, partial [Alistipes sp.]|nr:hypothetical protein [Alistipes sp.]
EANDAFFHIENGFIAGPSKTFTLKRPFAQLNAGQSMEDYNNMQLTGNSIIKSAAKTKAYAAMDLKTGAVVGSMVDVELTMNDVIDVDANGANDHLVLASGEEYKHLAMNYLLVNERELVDVELTLLGDEGTEFVRPYYQVPVQRNYRTNILGMLISAPSVFTVVIDAAFEKEHLNVLHAFQHGGEVTLQQNLYVGHPLVVKKGVNAVLNLNGRKIINYTTNEEPNTDVIIVEEGATLTINGDNNGNSEVRAVGGNSGYAVISEGTLIVNGGTFNSGKDAEGKTNAVLYARGNGKIYVNGGVFPNAQETGFVLNKKDADRATTEIVVKGGRFFKFNPEDNAAEGAGTNFVADGYHAIQDGDWFEVLNITYVYTVSEFNAALANEAVERIGVKADLDFGTGRQDITRDVEIWMNNYSVSAGGTSSTKNYGFAIIGANVVLKDLNMNGCGGFAVDGGKLVVEGGYLKPYYKDSGRHMFYGTSGGEIIINGGTFAVGRTGMRYFALENNAHAYVNGGVFEVVLANNQVPVTTATGAVLSIMGGKFGADPSNPKRNFNPTPWLAPGYKATLVDAGQYYEVTKE